MDNQWRMDNQISSLPVEQVGNKIMFSIPDGVSVIAEEPIHSSVSLIKESKYIGFPNVANTTKHYFGLIFEHIGMNVVI